MRYTLSMDGKNLGGSKLSAETYITFTHKAGEWDKITSNIFSGLKIYSFAVKYDVNENTNIWIGRHLNPKVANIGAIDGVQGETTVKNFTFGLAGGSRPDYMDYSFNAGLLQFGAYASHNVDNKNGSAQSSLAMFEQMNGAKTDRRFTYFQHSNSMIKNLNLFTSWELDLYKVENLVSKNTFDLTGFYFSARYRPWKKLSLFTSYDARKNVVCYETYKSFADQLLENETRQGYRFQFDLRPFKYFSFMANAGYRYRQGDARASKNASAYLSYSRLPWIETAISLNGTYLNTQYMDGIQYGVNLSHDFAHGKLMTTMNYRIVDYNFTNSPTGLFQNIGELSLSYRVMKKLSITSNYELTLEKSNMFHRVYVGIIQRF